MPRGIENNNPGNIVLTEKLWQGEVSRALNTDGKFKQFKTMNYGLQAMLKNLLYYFRTGSDTIAKIIGRWVSGAPEKEKAGYIKFITDYTGHGANSRIRQDENSLVALTKAMINYENGANNITEAQIRRALSGMDYSEKKEDFNYTGALSTGILIFIGLSYLDDHNYD